MFIRHTTNYNGEVRFSVSFSIYEYHISLPND